MAIDTAQRRRSISGISVPLIPGVTPNATPDIEWRQEAGWSYSGIEVIPTRVPIIREGAQSDLGVLLPSSIFSSEPLPLAPTVAEVELRHFHKNLLDYLRRLSAKLDNTDYRGDSTGLATLAAVFMQNFEILHKDGEGDFVWSPLKWTGTLHSNGIYEIDGKFIKVKTPGLYALHFTLEVPEKASNYWVVTRVRYVGLGLLRWGFTQSRDRMHVVTMPIPMDPLYPLSVEVATDASSNVKVEREGSRLLIYRLSRSGFDGGRFGLPTSIGDPIGGGYTRYD